MDGEPGLRKGDLSKATGSKQRSWDSNQSNF